MIGTTFGAHLRAGLKETFWTDLTQRGPTPYGSIMYYQVNLLLYARLLKRFEAVTYTHALANHLRVRLSILMCIGLYRFHWVDFHHIATSGVVLYIPSEFNTLFAP